jgi:hypothetical protein
VEQEREECLIVAWRDCRAVEKELRFYRVGDTWTARNVFPAAPLIGRCSWVVL